MIFFSSSFLTITFRSVDNFQPNMTKLQQQFQVNSHKVRQVEDKIPAALVPIQTEDNTERLTSAFFGGSSEKEEML